MSNKATLMEALKTALSTALPTRIVTRDFKDFAQRTSTELKNGVVTLIAQGSGDYGGYAGRFGTPGRLSIILVGQLQLTEGSSASDIEDAEFALLEEIESFCAAPGSPLGNLLLKGARQSGQIEHPYGWIACELELLQ